VLHGGTVFPDKLVRLIIFPNVQPATLLGWAGILV